MMYCGVSPFALNNRRHLLLESTSESFNSKENYSRHSGEYSFESAFYSNDDDSETYNTATVDDESTHYRKKGIGRRSSLDSETYNTATVDDESTYYSRGGRSSAERRNDSVDSYDDTTLRSDDWSAREDEKRIDRRSKYRKTWTADEYSVNERSTFTCDESEDDSCSYYSSDYSYSSAEESRQVRNYDADESINLLVGTCSDEEKKKNASMASMQSEIFDPFQVNDEEAPQFNPFPQQRDPSFREKDIINQQDSDYNTLFDFSANDSTFQEDDDFSAMLFNEKKMNVGQKVKSKAKSTVKWFKKKGVLKKKKMGWSSTHSSSWKNGSRSFNHEASVKDAIEYRRSVLSQHSMYESYGYKEGQSEAIIDESSSLAANIPPVKFSEKFHVFQDDVEQLNPEETNSLVIYENYGPANTVMMYFQNVDKPDVLSDDEVLVRIQVSFS